MNLKKIILLIPVVFFLTVLTTVAQTPAAANQPGASVLSRAEQLVKREKSRAQAENRLSRAEIAAQKKTLLATKAEAARRVAELKDEIARREQELEELASRQEKLRRESRQALQQLDELAGVVRTGTRDLLTLLENSPVSGDAPGRLAPLRVILKKTDYPGMAEIKTMVDLYLDEIRASAEIKRFKGEFIALDGRRRNGRVARLGALTAIVCDPRDQACGYAVYGPQNDALITVSEPGWWVRRNLEKFMAGSGNAVYIDFSGGDAVRRLALVPSAWERLKAGGFLVWPILLVGLVALLLASERFIFLSRVKSNTDKVMGRIIELVREGEFERCLELLENRKGPVFRVLRAGLEARRASLEVLENVLEEAILKELPRLEKFLPTLQVLAAIAPLLGLLGTVTGMINTFQVITVYGAGDPRMMSGGISEALITTKLGLTVAIPIILLHTWFARRVDTIIGDMEEKSVSLTVALRKNR
ncbi:MAG: hypothetical protein GXO34_06940 [Deltaproteobacteria bacterium]|nr:hypothetical protein [Deltaproteobacteria bacterium]